MKRLYLSLFAVLLVMPLPPAAQAQTADGFFGFVLKPGEGTGGVDRYEVTIRLQAAPETNLGSASLRLTFNDAVVQFPSNPSTNADLVEDTDFTPVDFHEQYLLSLDPLVVADYTTSDVSLPSANEVSINVVLSSTDIGKPLPATFTDVVVLLFDVIGAGTPDFAWTTSGANPTELFLEDNVTPFTLGSFTGADETPMPVELTTFTARTQGEDVILDWTTASETNNAGFAIEQALPGGWAERGFVDGAGTTAEGQAYTWTVAGLAPGVHPFRLKQVDFDGSVAYSPIVEVTVGVPQAYTLTEAYPNPFNPEARFSLTVQQAQHVRLAVYDLLGREVMRLHDGLLLGGTRHDFILEASGLPTGTYLYRAVGESFTATRTAVLLR